MTIAPPIKSYPLFRGWILFFCGICMGAADLVPGISGGTIAFILGFYPPLLESLQTLNWANFQLLLKGHWQEFSQKVAWKFLLTLLAGIGCAFIGLANFFNFILSHEIYRIYLYATFLGLILASFVFCIRQIKVWKRKTIAGLCLGALIAYLLTETTLTPSAEGDYAVPIEIEFKTVTLRNYDSQDHLLTGLSSQTLGILLSQGLLQDTTPVYNQQHVLIGLVGELVAPYRISFFNGWLVICGALAICALLLPGISGSYILTLLGVYPLVIESLVEFMNGLVKASFNTEAFSVLWSLGLGIGLGALGFARVLSWLLRHYSNQSLAILSGFMIGAIRSVWPFWSYEYIVQPLKLYKGPQLVALHPLLPSWDSPLVWQASFYAFMGFFLVFALEAYLNRASSKYLNFYKKLDIGKAHEQEL
jgi:putative membrane protein